MQQKLDGRMDLMVQYVGELLGKDVWTIGFGCCQADNSMLSHTINKVTLQDSGSRQVHSEKKKACLEQDHDIVYLTLEQRWCACIAMRKRPSTNYCLCQASI